MVGIDIVEEWEKIKDRVQSKVKVDDSLVDSLKVKYSSVSPKEFNDFILSKCKYFSKMNQETLEKFGFVEGKKQEFFDKVKEMITFIQEDYIKREPRQITEKKDEDEGFETLPQKTNLVVPHPGKLISEFAEELVSCVQDKNELFFRQEAMEIVEVTNIKKDKDFFTGFVPIRPNRFITLIEKYINPGTYIFNAKKEQWEFKFKSISGDLANTLLQSQIIQDNLPKIERIFTIPIPILYEGKLTFPKKGYDPRFKSFLDYNSPELIEMDIEIAKEVIESIVKEFCFQEPKDKTNAIASMITPFMRGLFSSFNVRTPLWIYIANRERAGKDYLAGINGILYEGYSLEEPPISMGEKDRGNNEELKKKILAAMMSGRKRLHFANNKGILNNSVLEAVLTAQKYSDRVLGKNATLTFDNEIDYSLSGNVGIGFTPDLANRSKFIRLFLDIEDANSRRFDNPDLHSWVQENRGLVLSAFYTLVKTWINNGMNKGKVPFTSFHEWSDVVGGIMESAGYDNPCSPDREALLIGGDTDTSDMKRLFEICNEHWSGESWISKKEIKELVKSSGEDIFLYYNFEKREDETINFTKFIGRVLSGIRLVVDNPNGRSTRQRFRFVNVDDEIKRQRLLENEK
jgi:hypothetical protein